MLAKLITYLTVLPPLVTTILKLIEAVERPGHGEEKKNAVIQFVGVAFDSFEATVTDTPLTREDIENMASKLIDICVTFYNLIGKFKHGGENQEE